MNDPVSIAALAPLIALIGALTNGLFGRNIRPGVIGSVAVGVSFALSLIAAFSLFNRDPSGVVVELWPYLSAGNFDLSLGFMIDRLSVLLMLVITGVGLLIHVYSIGYMRADKGLSRYFAGLNLFVAAMLVLVMADSFLLMFIGWEGVGVCSYLLISFWYQDRLNADAARKAFIVNRIGDVGFLLAMFLMVTAFGTLDIATINQAAISLVVGSGTLVWIGLLLLVAASGKSAQIPLQVWLPDAMAGPTPVSAVIHAATMVTAGVYLVVRSAPLFVGAPEVSVIVAWVGAITALIAAFAAFAQTDIKKILAYSTISQLAFMFVAVGAGAYWVGIFHLFTHAFFKALLFLGAGSVIHALDGEQDIRRMGGLGRRMRVTGTTSLIATLAIAGVPLLSGFFSKDAILAHAFNSNLLAGNGAVVIYAILLLSAGMTAFYMFRWYHGIFVGQERIAEELKAKIHESPQVMTVPLIILSIFSIGVGYVGLPAFAFPNLFASWIEPAARTLTGFAHPAIEIEWALLVLSIVAAAIGLGVAYWVYEVKKGGPVVRLRDQTINRLSQTGFGFDNLYRIIFVRPVEAIAEGVRIIDKDLIDQVITNSIGSFGLLSRVVRRLQSGFVRSYAFVMLLSVSVLVVLVTLFGGKL